MFVSIIYYSVLLQHPLTFMTDNSGPEKKALRLLWSESLQLVPSGTADGVKYEVIVKFGLCSCKAGAAGAFCKHQALLHHTHGGVFPNCPPITSADRYLLGVLALGKECPPKTRFTFNK